jgi:hypothetical protein
MASRLVTLARRGLRGVACAMVAAVFAAVFAAGPASAQTFDWRLQATENGQSAIIGNDAQLPFLTTVGSTVTATVVATYIGPTQATISLQPQYSGSTEFTVMNTITAPPPEVFNPNQSFTLTIQFSPTNASPASGVITINYTEPGTSTSGAPVQNSIVIDLAGAAPSFTLSYVLQSVGNQVAISSGGTIPFGPTQINTTASADLDINNQGSGPGVITGITQPPAGSPFKVTGIPLLPDDVNAGTYVPLLVQYTPRRRQTIPPQFRSRIRAASQ